MQLSHGLVSCSEWSGVLLSTLLREAGLKNSARWIVAEGADASRHSRSIPVGKALDDVIVAYGRMVRPCVLNKVIHCASLCPDGKAT